MALHLVGSYLGCYRHSQVGSLATYLADLRSPELLDHLSLTQGADSPTEHERPVADTFALSFSELDPTDRIDALSRAILCSSASRRVSEFGEPYCWRASLSI
jgi:hypothetical protein